MEPASTEAPEEPDIAPITLANQLQSSLLRLPAEIRNNIYHHVFSEDAVKIYPRWYSSYECTAPTGSIALLRTCRQILKEAHGLFMSTTTFGVQICGIENFVLRMGATKAAFVTSIICHQDEVQEFRGKLKHRYKNSCKAKLPSLVRLHISVTNHHRFEGKRTGTWSMLSFVTGHRSLAHKADVTFSH